ncbi:unnamed protein product [Acanthosepion pharaonis]|uniref:Uncharacterized protein n=1 Tax=Acanthosepion pharaonis TaxID=158019 RepID=A0A812E6J9_ACAPH|nr:unnamed protein product [Sepia pharaonis]
MISLTLSYFCVSSFRFVPFRSIFFSFFTFLAFFYRICPYINRPRCNLFQFLHIICFSLILFSFFSCPYFGNSLLSIHLICNTLCLYSIIFLSLSPSFSPPLSLTLSSFFFLPPRLSLYSYFRLPHTFSLPHTHSSFNFIRLPPPRPVGVLFFYL